MEPVSPLTKVELFEQCEIRLLYIEPGVFGELCPCPAMPPAPLPIGIFESTTANVPRLSQESANGSNGEVPLNLIVNLQVENHQTMNAVGETNGNISSNSNAVNYNVTVDTTGNNKDLLVNGDNNDNEPWLGFDTYADAQLSGTMEQVFNHLHLEELSNLISEQTMDIKNDTEENAVSVQAPPEFPACTSQVSDNTPDAAYDGMWDCLV